MDFEEINNDPIRIGKHIQFLKKLLFKFQMDESRVKFVAVSSSKGSNIFERYEGFDLDFVSVYQQSVKDILQSENHKSLLALPFVGSVLKLNQMPGTGAVVLV